VGPTPGSAECRHRRSGAAGNRTRVPRPHCWGSTCVGTRMISDHGAPRPSSSVDLVACSVPISPTTEADRWSLVMSIRPSYEASEADRRGRYAAIAISSLAYMVPTRFVEVASASSARSPGSGPATVETMSAPCLGVVCASTLCSFGGAGGRLSGRAHEGNAPDAPGLPEPPPSHDHRPLAPLRIRSRWHARPASASRRPAGLKRDDAASAPARCRAGRRAWPCPDACRRRSCPGRRRTRAWPCRA
jgi:hypothetical protein